AGELMLFFGLAWEAGDDLGCHREAWNRLAVAFDRREHLLDPVDPAHLAQNGVGRALERKLDVTDLAEREDLAELLAMSSQPPRVEEVNVEREVPRDLVEAAKQLDDRGADVFAVRARVLAGENNSLHALFLNQGLHFLVDRRDRNALGAAL